MIVLVFQGTNYSEFVGQISDYWVNYKFFLQILESLFFSSIACILFQQAGLCPSILNTTDGIGVVPGRVFTNFEGRLLYHRKAISRLSNLLCILGLKSKFTLLPLCLQLRKVMKYWKHVCYTLCVQKKVYYISVLIVKQLRFACFFKRKIIIQVYEVHKSQLGGVIFLKIKILSINVSILKQVKNLSAV